MFESLWAAFTLGAIWVPTNYRLTPPEVAYLASSSGAKAMICDDAFAQHADTARAASAALEHRIAIGTPRTWLRCSSPWCLADAESHGCRNPCLPTRRSEGRR